MTGGTGQDPYQRYEEGAMAVSTLEQFLAEREQEAKKEQPLVIDFTAPENQGGSWLNEIRRAAERLRLALRKEARKKKPKK